MTSLALYPSITSVSTPLFGLARSGQRVTCSVKPRKANPPPAAAAKRHLFPHYVEPQTSDDQDTDRAYWTDDEVSPVLLSDEADSWQDSNYVGLSMRSYRIVREETQNALQSHFLMQQKQQQQQSTAATPSHHSVCASTPTHTFCCGEDGEVAAQVSPACVHGGGVFYGTTH